MATSTTRKLPAEGIGTFLLVLAYALGPVSGAHVNPAVTLAMVAGRRMPISEAIPYWIAQFIGAISAGGMRKVFVSSFGVTDYSGALGATSYDNGAWQITRTASPEDEALVAGSERE